MRGERPQPARLFQRERRYRYTAKNSAGRRVRGTALAPDRETLSRRLHGQGLYLLSAVEEDEGGRRMLKNAQLSELCRQMAGLLSSGIPLARALDVIAGEEGADKAIGRLCISLLCGVRSGISLAEAMEREGVFPPLALGMVRAGETAGDLDGVLDRLALHYEKQHRMEQSVRSALTYPVILSVMALAVVLVIFTLVLPQFHDLFDGLDTLPLTTRALMSVSDFLVRYWYLPPLILAAGVVAGHLALRIGPVRRGADRLKLYLPGVGGVLRTLYTARFARSLSSLYSGGTPILAALCAARDALGNTYLMDQFEEVVQSVRSGAPLSAALSGVEGFRPRLISAIEVGEESGRLEEMLSGAASAMELDAQHGAKRLMTVLEPVLVVVMAAVVGFIMIGVMLPIVQSYSTLESAAHF